MIHCTDIHKSYGSLEVLRGVDLHISSGEVVSIVGPSGAGKTTLLQIIGTLATADSGSVVIDSRSISSLKAKELTRLRNEKIGFVFQFHHLLPEFTAIENICIPAWIGQRASRTAVHQRALELLDMLELGHRADHKPAELSGGEQQRVAVARALINNPSVILADEPSGNLDSHNRDELHKLFFTLRERFGHTFLIVTHDKDLAQMSDRQIVMRDGVIISQ